MMMMDWADEEPEFVLPIRPRSKSSQVFPSTKSILCKPHEYAFGVLSNFVEEAGERVMADVLKVLYSQGYIRSGYGSMSVYTYCLSSYRMTGNEIRDKFGGVGDLLFCDIRGRDMLDVNFAYKVMVELCGVAFDCLSQRCKSLIESVIHYKIHIAKNYEKTDQNFPAEVERFFEVVRSLYKLVGQEFNKDFRGRLSFIEYIKDLTLRDKVPFEKPTFIYNANVWKCRKDTAPRMLIKARKELQQHYRRLEVSNPFTWMDDLWYYRTVCHQSVRIPPKELLRGKVCIERIYSPLKVAGTGKVIDVKHLLTTTKMVDGKEVLTSVLLMSGEIGSGKTALCYHLVQDWYNGTDKIDGVGDLDLLLLLEHRKIGSQSLTEYLKKRILRRTWRNFANEKIIPFLKGLNVLFILDGYDEGTADTFKVLQDILEHFGKKRILITTQPECKIHTDLAVLMWGNKINFLRLEVLGMEEPSLQAMAEVAYTSLLKKPEESLKKLCNFLDFHFSNCGRWTRDLMRYPVTAALYVAQWEEHYTEVHTATELYDAFFKLSLKRLVERKVCDQKTADQVLNTQLPILLGDMAWEMLKQRKHTLSDDVLVIFKDTLINSRIDHYEVLLAFLDCTFDRIKIPIGMGFSFINKSQQAYYASKYLADKIISNELAVFCMQQEYKHWKKLSSLLMFLVGQLVARDVNNVVLQLVLGVIFDARLPADDYAYWWNLYVESGGHECVSNFIAKTRLPKLRWVLNASNVLPALKLLGSTPVELKSLEIDIPNTIDPYGILDLLSVMEGLPLSLQDRYSMKNTIEVHLHFRYHYERGGRQPSDAFLMTLRPWGTLVNFTGEIGEQQQMGRDPILHPWHLRSFRVRVATVGTLSTVHGRVLKYLTPRCISALHLDGLGYRRGSEDVLVFLPRLERPNLELYFQKVSTENRTWAITSIKTLARRKGLWRVCIKNCTLTLDSAVDMLKTLSGYITDRLTIGGVRTEAQRQKLDRAANFEVTYL